jgi:hypothetical protein
MKQKRLKDKRQNTINMKNKRTASSATYKPIKPATRDHQNSNYDNQIDNKDNNRNIDMSIGLEEDKKKTKIMDQKEEKPLSPKEAVTPSSQPFPTSSSSLLPIQSELFDSSRDNAICQK